MTVLNKGDSGAWVTDNETHEVYGHVVASEAFGRAHVIPMNDIFSDITTRLSLLAVGLAFQDEILSVLSIEARFDKLSTPLGLKAVDSSSATSDKTFPKSNNSISAASTDLEEPAEGTQFRSNPQLPPALPYPHLPQAFSTLHDSPEVGEGYASLTATGIPHNAPEVDEGYGSKEVTPQGSSEPSTQLNTPAPFYSDANPGTRYNGPFPPQMFRQYPSTNAGQGPENHNVYQYQYYGPPMYNMYPGAPQSSIPYAPGYYPYTPGYNPYAPSYSPYTPSFNPIPPGFSPHDPSGPHKSGTDSGYASWSGSPQNQRSQ